MGLAATTGAVRVTPEPASGVGAGRGSARTEPGGPDAIEVVLATKSAARSPQTRPPGMRPQALFGRQLLQLAALVDGVNASELIDHLGALGGELLDLVDDMAARVRQAVAFVRGVAQSGSRLPVFADPRLHLSHLLSTSVGVQPRRGMREPSG